MKLGFYYDFSCPFCVRAYKFFHKVLSEFPTVEVEWLPTEAHPRPEDWHPHTDLCIEAFHAATELGADPRAVNEALIVAATSSNVERPEVVLAALKGVADTDKIGAVLRSGKYKQTVLDTNDRFDRDGGWAVPAFRMNGAALDAVGGVGVTEEQLRGFIKKNSESGE